MQTKITHLFCDVGGVLLTNGWDRNARRRAVEKFGLDEIETQERHHLIFDTYECGKITLTEYLDRVVFYKERSFTQADFANFMYAQSQPLADMIELVKEIKHKYALKIVVVNNEGKELNEHRIKTFNLTSFVDFFISSALVHLRKPDTDIFKLALNVAQVLPQHVLYIDDRDMFVQVAQELGINGLAHKDLATTKTGLQHYGLV